MLHFRGNIVGAHVDFRLVASFHLPESSFAYKYCRVWPEMKDLKDETRPRVENRRVGPPLCRENGAIAVFLRQYQGLRSLVLVRWFAALRGPSRYAQIRVFASKYSSDVQGSRFNVSSRRSLAWPPRNTDLII